jgi:RNA polymerase sigma-70 factor (ECF subfamily)
MESEYWKYIDHFESESFRELMLLYGRDVWNYAFLLTHNPDQADDISQDVFLQVYRKIGSFRGESSIRTWLFSITRNRVFNHRRTAFFRKVSLVGFVVRSDTHPSAEQEALMNSLSNDLWKIVMELPIKFREVLLLNAKYELSQKEIANLLGLSEGTVKSRLFRARQKVNDMWKGGALHERATT